MQHLDRYDLIVMLRTVWDLPLIHYQLLEIPIALLRRIETAALVGVGYRVGRQSLGADVTNADGERLFHVHFDASDGKCSIRDLNVRHCHMLLEWDFKPRD
jgi:hypothetical protein